MLLILYKISIRNKIYTSRLRVATIAKVILYALTSHIHVTSHALLLCSSNDIFTFNNSSTHILHVHNYA